MSSEQKEVESFEEIRTYYSRVGVQSLSDYEKDHMPRLKHLLHDLKLDKIKDSKICDFGCGGGYILKNLHKSNEVIGIDGYEVIDNTIEREEFNLDAPFAEDFLLKYGQVDIAFSFEMFEHLTNPYNFMFELKKVLKQDGLLYFSVPHPATQHNTFYPGLIYPVQNLVDFFGQMSYEVVEKKVHSARFVQNVFVLRNKSWEHVKMKWPKKQEKFKGQPPHIQVNL